VENKQQIMQQFLKM